MKKLFEFDWIFNKKNHFAYVSEVLTASQNLIIARYFSEVMIMANGEPYMNPLIKFERKQKNWKVYFLDHDNDQDIAPIFERSGLPVMGFNIEKIMEMVA